MSDSKATSAPPVGNGRSIYEYKCLAIYEKRLNHFIRRINITIDNSSKILCFFYTSVGLIYGGLVSSTQEGQLPGDLFLRYFRSVCQYSSQCEGTEYK